MEEGLTHNIETIRQIQCEYWKRYQVAQPSSKIKLLSLIKNTTINLDKLYKSIPSLEKMKKETKDAKEKLDKLKTDTQTAIVNHTINKC